MNNHTDSITSTNTATAGSASCKTMGPEIDHDGFTATYSPDDNKLRLRSAARLDPELYARVKAAGFRWAPQQELFVAPMWTPEREDLLIELSGSIGDEDVSLVERAEVRAERFDQYSDDRTADASAARAAVSAIADGIPFGQPILVGHHSERRARKDAEKIENNMRKAVKMWETAEYWQRRAVGALRHAEYKERPDVRARRIKVIEADLRKQEKNIAAAKNNLRFWTTIHDDAATLVKRKDGQPTTFMERALHAANVSGFGIWSDLNSGTITPEEAQRRALEITRRSLAHSGRWADHYRNRLAYERAMLAESGGTAADVVKPEKGGACRCWASPRGGWAYIQKVNKVSVTILRTFNTGGRKFTQTMPFDKLTELMSCSQVEQARTEGRLIEDSDKIGFALLDSRPTDPVPPTPTEKPAPEAAEKPADDAREFAAMRAALKNGTAVQAVVAPQLFPTPIDVAERMADLLGIAPGDRVLEPSAGTGRLIGALGCRMFSVDREGGEIVAVEINGSLCSLLRREFPLTRVINADFLDCDAQSLGGLFTCIVMNPPFKDAIDIRHILHAWSLLAPGGRLVAICAGGPRQHEQLRPLVEARGGIWEPLPDDTFSESGTQVHTVLLTMEKSL